MEKLKTLSYHNELLLNTSLFKYLSIINEKNISPIIRDVIYDNFILTTTSFLKNAGEETINKYREEMREPYERYIEKTLREGWAGIKHNLLVSSLITFELFLNHLVDVYYKNFPELYSNDDISVSFSVLRDFKNQDDMREYVIHIHLEKFAHLDLQEKILYIKKNLKLNSDEIWAASRKDYLQDICRLRGRHIFPGEGAEIPDGEFYAHINYLCSLIFKLSVYSRTRYGVEFEWIKDLSRYLHDAVPPG
ncbi:MAG: hypothetical protein LBK27_06660 [Treponema sp.]|nr:hypothetical protein [Treponema sp.]